jgi:hypothetical protein
MNLFLQTRALTQAREDHLTCFIAAALETDAVFRTGYEELVLSSLALDGSVPTIVGVRTQTSFAAQRSVPDMLLTLADGRRVICEHKLDAAETEQEQDDGQMSLQLERYLRIPDIDGLAYFRSGLKAPADDVLTNPLYLRPASAKHFLWRDLYPALSRSDSQLSSWLRDGFEHLGFTPVVPHIGALVTEDKEDEHRAQVNFGKLWMPLRERLSSEWNSETGTSSALYLVPKRPLPVEYIFLFPLAQQGSLLRIRVRMHLEHDEQSLAEVRRRLEALAPTLPVPVPVDVTRQASGHVCLDLVCWLHLLLGEASDVETQEARLLEQVIPIADALAGLPTAST